MPSYTRAAASGENKRVVGNILSTTSEIFSFNDGKDRLPGMTCHSVTGDAGSRLAAFPNALQRKEIEPARGSRKGLTGDLLRLRRR